MTKSAALFACLAATLGACSQLPRSGPPASAVSAATRTEGQVLFDLVDVDDRALAILHAQPQRDFAARFKKYTPPDAIRIAVGDTIVVSLWESGPGGLFTAPFSEAPPSAAAPPLGSATPTTPSTALPSPALPTAPIRPGIPSLPSRPTLPTAPLPPGGRGVSGGSPANPPEAGTVPPILPTPRGGGARVVALPDQIVGSDGAITIPYAGRVPAAGRSPAELEQEIERRLIGKALMPQAQVVVVSSAANSVTAAGEVVKGARIPLSAGGDRLLQVIAAAGGAKAPVRDTFVRLSRGRVTATIPLETLVSDPAENIYAAPGDVLTLVERPQTFSVFGAAGSNAAIPFGADRLSLAEALAKAKGLSDFLANPGGVFLFRWESDRVVRALGQPIATGAPPGLSPVAYHFDLGNGKSYFLARRFPIRDKDVIFIADAVSEPLHKMFLIFRNITGPIVTGLIVCRRASC